MQGDREFDDRAAVPSLPLLICHPDKRFPVFLSDDYYFIQMIIGAL
jgi:hypothetical protein